MPEALALIAMLFVFALGFMLGGIFYGRAPFWDG